MPDVDKGFLIAAIMLMLVGWGIGKALGWLFAFIHFSLAFPS